MRRSSGPAASASATLPAACEASNQRPRPTTAASDGSVGVFSIPASGGAVTTIASGAPFVDPSGITVSADGGTLFVVDTRAAGSGRAQVIKVVGGVATVFLAAASVGYPAGVALVQDGSALLVSGLDPTSGTDAVWRYDATAATAPAGTPFTKGISGFSEPAGLHRAKNGDSYAWADSVANGTGTVFVLSK